MRQIQGDGGKITVSAKTSACGEIRINDLCWWRCGYDSKEEVAGWLVSARVASKLGGVVQKASDRSPRQQRYRQQTVLLSPIISSGIRRYGCS